MTGRGGGKAGDTRWMTRVQRIMEAQGILWSIERKRHFIDAHATHPNILEVAVNLKRIHEEATEMAYELARIKEFLIQFRVHTEEDIYRYWEERESGDQMGSGNGSGQRVKLPKNTKSKRRPRPKYRGSRAKLNRPGK